MLIKRIIVWALTVLLITTAFMFFQFMNELLILITVMSVAVLITLLIQLYSESKKFKKISKYSCIISSCLLFLILLGIGFNFLIDIAEILAAIVGLLLVISIVSTIVTYKKIDISILLLMSLSFLGLFFKKMHWPGAGPLIVLGWAVPALLFLFIIYERINEYDNRTNRFLNFFKNFICVTITVNFLGATFKTMHWPGASILVYIALILAIFSILILVFLLPNSNFIEWTAEHKKRFYRVFLFPLIYLAILTAMGFVFPETFKYIFFGKSKDVINPFWIEYYEIPLKEGMSETTYSN